MHPARVSGKATWPSLSATSSFCAVICLESKLFDRPVRESGSNLSQFHLEPLASYAGFQGLYVIALYRRLCVTHCFGNITK